MSTISTNFWERKSIKGQDTHTVAAGISTGEPKMQAQYQLKEWHNMQTEKET